MPRTAIAVTVGLVGAGVVALGLVRRVQRTTESAKMLREVVDIYSPLMDPRIEPALDSPAAQELRDASGQPAEDGLWGEGPVREAYAHALMGHATALECGKAMVPLMNGAFTAIPAIMLARGLVETAGQTWWLMEPGIGHIRRVQRLQILRYRSAVEGKKAAEADGVPEDQYDSYTETITEVEEDSRRLKLDVPIKRGNTYSCGGEELPSATSLVRGLFDKVDVPSIYNLYSGYMHGQRFALLREFYRTMDGSDIHYQPMVNTTSLDCVAAAAIYALYPPGERLSSLFGLDRSGKDDD